MTFPKKTIQDIQAGNLTDRNVLVRVDFNVPIEDGTVTDTTRLDAAEPTIRFLLDHGAKPILMSHLGRPGGTVDESLRLDPVVSPLESILHCDVLKADDATGGSAREMVHDLEAGQVGLLENLRFSPGERNNDPEFARGLADLADQYVNDAFGASHRRHASITGVPNHLSPAVAGELIYSEYQVLHEVHDNPDRPFVALLGGAKISDKLNIIEALLSRADWVLVGGAMAYTFMLAENGSVGDSLVEPDFVDEARRILEHRDDYQGEIVLPEDVVTAQSIEPGAETRVVPYGEIEDGWEGVDIGPQTRQQFTDIIQEAGMVFWNGPLGIFEIEEFAEGTDTIANVLADSSANVVIGGGDSASAVHQAGLRNAFYHVSTGGGASLQMVEKGTLPGIDALDDRT